MEGALPEETDELPLPAAEPGDGDGAVYTGFEGPEPRGVADADELLVSQLEDFDDDGGLDVVAGVDGGLDVAFLVDAEEAAGALDHGAGPLGEEAVPMIDATGDEDGWLADSEGDGSLLHAELVDDEPGSDGEDGGIEGTDDALYEPLDDVLPALVGDDDGDDAAADELEQELIGELGRGA